MKWHRASFPDGSFETGEQTILKTKSADDNSLLLFLAAFGEPDALAANGDHPPADLPTEPDFVGTWHCQISDQRASEKRLDGKIRLAALAFFFTRA
jgi:hypothetical protein